MRELTTRIRFITPCLGNDKKTRTIRVKGRQKKRTFFLFSRTCEGQVIFLPQWWKAVLRDAAQVRGKFHKEVQDIRFSLEVDGLPRATPENFYKRYYDADKFSPHEAFFEGDVVGVTCLVPASISDEEFWRLMAIAGKYYGISPAHAGKFGHFSVLSITRRGPDTDHSIEPPQLKQEKTSGETSTVTTQKK